MQDAQLEELLKNVAKATNLFFFSAALPFFFSAGFFFREKRKVRGEGLQNVSATFEKLHQKEVAKAIKISLIELDVRLLIMSPFFFNARFFLQKRKVRGEGFYCTFFEKSYTKKCRQSD